MIFDLRKRFVVATFAAMLAAQDNSFHVKSIIGQHEDVLKYSDSLTTLLGISDHFDLEKRISKTEELLPTVEQLYRIAERLNLRWLLDDGLFASLLEKGIELERHLPIGVVHRVSNIGTRHRTNIAYCPKQRYKETLAKRRFTGENFGSSYENEDGYTHVNLICGSSQYLPDEEDSYELCDLLWTKLTEYFDQIIERRYISPAALLELTWESLEEDSTEAGCFSALQADISPQNKIRIANLGGAWAGLYRNGELIEQTVPQFNPDGTQIQICNRIPDTKLKYVGSIHDSGQYNWDAQRGDIFIVVSPEVRQMLEPSEIKEAFTEIRNLGPVAKEFLSENDFELISMGIIKAAKMAAGDQPENDMFAFAIGIEGREDLERESFE